MNSRDKGKRGELELAAFLRDEGFDARRGVQHAGGPDSPDVVCDVPGVHFECKRVEHGSPYAWLAQAMRDAGERMPVVAHRRNRCEWVAILPLKAFLSLFPRPVADPAGAGGEGRELPVIEAPEVW